MFRRFARPGVLASVPFSIRLSSAADLNETSLRLSNDPFSFAPYVLSTSHFLMVNFYTFLDPLGPFPWSAVIPSWYLPFVALAILVPQVTLVP